MAMWVLYKSATAIEYEEATKFVFDARTVRILKESNEGVELLAEIPVEHVLRVQRLKPMGDTNRWLREGYGNV